MVHHLVYVSSSPAPLSEDAIDDILETSRRNNAAVGVTGVLLHGEGNIIQVLEGPREAVEGVFERVRRDARHRQVQVLLREAKERRYFGDWSMGFSDLDAVPESARLDADDRTHVNRLLRRDFDPEALRTDPQRAHRLLLSFRRIAAGHLPSL